MSKGYKKRGFVTDVNKKITDLIVGKLKSGQIPWISPYQSTDFSQFTSFFKGDAYKGLNKVLLWITKQENQLQSNAFITFNQATEVASIPPEKMADARDKKKKDVTLNSINHPLAGQKSVGFVVFNSPMYKDSQGKAWSKKESNGKVRKEPTKSEIAKEDIKVSWITRSYAVWSIDQMSYMPEKWQEKRNNAGKIINKDVLEGTQDQRISNAVKSLIQKNNIKVVTGEEPNYDHERDVIVMPKLNDFVSDSSFYRTLLHQVMHWTGSKERLDRKFDKVYGDKSSVHDLAQEELVAELGSAFMCQRLGIDSFASSNLEYHASMINPWINLMEDNTKAITFASSRADKAMNYLARSLEKELSHDVKPTEPDSP